MKIAVLVSLLLFVDFADVNAFQSVILRTHKRSFSSIKATTPGSELNEMMKVLPGAKIIPNVKFLFS
jgi:hypothetical protein